jgi:plastocyanin
MGIRRSFLAMGRLLVWVVCAGVPAACPQSTVTARVTVSAGNSGPRNPTNGAKDAVVWLSPLDRAAGSSASPAKSKRPLLTQRDKSFDPHLLVVETGTTVDFPNRDPFFHNVFSLFDGKRFDLGLYEAGTTNAQRFDRAGVSFLFCNIHPQMSAIVVSVDTPYFGKADSQGNVLLHGVPDGRYQVHVWYERSLPEDLKRATRDVTVAGPNFDLGTLQIAENPTFSTAHKNKYGQDYAPPPENSYDHP